MEKKMWSLVYLYEGYDDKLPYASVIAVADDIEIVKEQMAKEIALDCQTLEDEDDEYFEYKNFEIIKESTYEVLLRHKVYVDCYTKYSIQMADVLS